MPGPSQDEFCYADEQRKQIETSHSECRLLNTNKTVTENLQHGFRTLDGISHQIKISHWSYKLKREIESQAGQLR